MNFLKNYFMCIPQKQFDRATIRKCKKQRWNKFKHFSASFLLRFFLLFNIKIFSKKYFMLPAIIFAIIKIFFDVFS